MAKIPVCWATIKRGQQIRCPLFHTPTKRIKKGFRLGAFCGVMCTDSRHKGSNLLLTI